jgi:hypothetical protein
MEIIRLQLLQYGYVDRYKTLNSDHTVCTRIYTYHMILTICFPAQKYIGGVLCKVRLTFIHNGD